MPVFRHLGTSSKDFLVAKEQGAQKPEMESSRATSNASLWKRKVIHRFHRHRMDRGGHLLLETQQVMKLKDIQYVSWWNHIASFQSYYLVVLVPSEAKALCQAPQLKNPPMTGSSPHQRNCCRTAPLLDVGAQSQAADSEQNCHQQPQYSASQCATLPSPNEMVGVWLDAKTWTTAVVSVVKKIVNHTTFDLVSEWW